MEKRSNAPTQIAMSAWITGSCIFSPLGIGTDVNYSQLRKSISGLTLLNDPLLSDNPLFGGRIDSLKSNEKSSRFETLCQAATNAALHDIKPDPERSLYLLSTTKGNIRLLDSKRKERFSLHALAKFLAGQAGFKYFLTISNACISGVLAIIVAKRLLDAGQYDHVIIVGADELSKFVCSGFESLKALSSGPCRPFDLARNGISLGEAAGVIILSSRPTPLKPGIRITGGGLSNDANHISGPSRTGDELGLAVRQALGEAGRSASEIDLISAHGTGTVFNDEMEARSFYTLGLQDVPLNSLKGYFGHTLGAAGVVESIISAESLLKDEVLATAGYEQSGVSRPLNICKQATAEPLNICLKTASGFGGCNAAIILEKDFN